MLSPTGHLKSLERHLAQHEAKIEALERTSRAIASEIRRQRKMKDAERDALPQGKREHGLALRRAAVGSSIKAHRALLELGRDKRTVTLIRRLASRPELAREAAHDPMGYARENGLPLPPGIVLAAVVTPQHVTLRIRYLNEFAPGQIVWGTDGFSAPRLVPEAPAAAAKPAARAPKRKTAPDQLSAEE